MKTGRTPVEKMFRFLVIVSLLVVFVKFSVASSEPDPRLLCINAIRAQAKFPTKVDFHFRFLQTAPMKDDPDATGVRGRADMMNGFGSMIPHVFGCEVKNGIVINAAATPG